MYQAYCTYHKGKAAWFFTDRWGNMQGPFATYELAQMAIDAADKRECV